MLVAALFMRERVLEISPSWLISRGLLNTRDPKISSKRWFAYFSLYEEEKQFSQSYLNEAIQHSQATLSEAIQYVNIHLSSLTVPNLSNFKDNSYFSMFPLMILILQTNFCFYHHVLMLLVFIHPSPNLFLLFLLPNFLKLLKTLACSSSIQTQQKRSCLLLNQVLLSLGLHHDLHKGLL